jgi:pimeloyl-ACP methyl ester carboxylesterase
MLHSQVLGSGPPLVVLHGLFGAGENLRSIAKPLSSSWEVHLVDLPNHGYSHHTERCDYLTMSNEVIDYIRSLSGAVGLLGHSMGGKVAMAVALREAERVSRLVCLDIAPRPYAPSHVELMDALIDLDLAELESRSDADRKLSEAIPSRTVRSFLLKNLVHEDDEFRWKLNLTVLRRDYDHILDWPDAAFEGLSYGNPVLFLAGERSDYLKPERDRETIAEWFPDAELQTIKKAGHWIHVDAYEEVLERSRAFLGEVQ